MKKPRIGFIGTFFGKDADRTTSQEYVLSDLFARDGYRVCKASRIMNPLIRTLHIVQALVAWRSKIDIVIIAVFSGRAFVWADFASSIAQVFHKPVVFWLHGGGLPDFFCRHTQWISYVLKRGKAIIAPSTYLADFFDRKGFRVEIIPNLISLDNYSFRERNRIKPNFLWMRAFHSIYNPEIAVNVFAQLKKIYPQAILTMAGRDKGLLRRTKALVSREKLSDSVNFPGFLAAEQKQKAFAAHDVFLNTSCIDNMPVSLLEAAAAGLPIITTNVGGIPSIFENGKTALLTDSLDVASMVEAAQRLLRQPGLASQLSRQARKIAEQCDTSIILEQWKDLLQNTVSLAKATR